MKSALSTSRMVSFIGITLLSLTIIGCDQPTTAAGGETVPLGDVIIEQQYTNAAWAFILRGSVVDASGMVRTYEMHEAVRLPEMEKDGTWSSDSLMKKYLLNDTIRASVPADTLVRLLQFAAQVEEKTMSDTMHVGADMGMQTLVIYRKDPATGRYRRILITQSGDFQCRNTSAAAEEVRRWAERHLP